MSTWLYQMDADEWPPETFRNEIWEGRSWRWERRKMKSATDAKPEVGDTILFYYCKNHCTDWGFYGWAVLDRYDEKLKRLHFMPATPTNWLKMDPWRDNEASSSEVQTLANSIRGKMMQGTLFQIEKSEHIQSIRLGIRRHFNGRE